MKDFELLESHEGRRLRLRSRIMEEGIEELAPHEVVEFLLYYAIPRQDVNDLAHALLERFGNIRGIAAAGYDALMAVEGMGDHAARMFGRIDECFHACTDCMTDPNQLTIISNYAQAFAFAAQIRSENQPPCAFQLCLDPEGHLMYHNSFCSQPRWGGAKEFRIALNDAICAETRDIIVMIYTGQHTPTPSSYDIEHARSYAQLLHTARCALLDVILIGTKRIISMRYMGLIPDFNFSEKQRNLRERYMQDMPEEGAPAAAFQADACLPQ